MNQCDWSEMAVERSPDHVSCDLQGDAAILCLRSGVYFTLNPIGARVWQLLATRAQVSYLIDTIRAEYQVAPAQCEKDIHALLDDLQIHGLLIASADDRR